MLFAPKFRNYGNNMFLVDFYKIKDEGIKGILLDLDNTLYEYEACHSCALESCYKEFKKSKNITFEQFKNSYESAKKEVKKNTFGQAASHSRFLYFQKLLEENFKKTDIDLTIELEKCYWLNFFKRMKLFKGVLDFLKKCRKNNIKICFITDLTAEIQFKKIKHLKIGKYLDFVVSSEEAGRDKPHQNIFRLAFQKLKMRPSDVVLIGDDYNKDLAGGEQMGIKTILIK